MSGGVLSLVNRPGPAYRIETARLLLRCWEPTDEPALAVAIAASVEHLRPWMPWAASEPISPEQRVKLLRGFRAAFDSDRDYVYGMFTPDGKEVLGGTGLHPRIGPGAREIGYWVHIDHVGRGFATEATAALTRVAFEIDGVRRVEVRCDPANQRSRRVPEKLGFTCDGVLRSHVLGTSGEPRDTMVWSLVQAEYEGSLPSRAELAAYDVTGARIL